MLVVFGAGGQVGTALTRLAGARSLAVRALGHGDADICDADAVRRALEGAAMAANCAAYTQVDKAEAEADAANAVNARAPGVIAEACAARDIPFLHISTDYVFSGAPGRPWREDDATEPLSVYGRSKRAGEEAVRRAHARHLILRTAWVFSGGGNNFVRTILRLARERDSLGIVDDQTGGPTAADGIAAAILDMLGASTGDGFSGWGTYHFCGAPPVTWCGFARAICAEAGIDIPIRAIATEDFPTPADRPRNSVLDCAKIRDVFGIAQPDWRVALSRAVAELSGA